jgi:hypothetical protein
MASESMLEVLEFSSLPQYSDGVILTFEAKFGGVSHSPDIYEP